MPYLANEERLKQGQGGISFTVLQTKSDLQFWPKLSTLSYTSCQIKIPDGTLVSSTHGVPLLSLPGMWYHALISHRSWFGHAHCPCSHANKAPSSDHPEGSEPSLTKTYCFQPIASLWAPPKELLEIHDLLMADRSYIPGSVWSCSITNVSYGNTTYTNI